MSKAARRPVARGKFIALGFLVLGLALVGPRLFGYALLGGRWPFGSTIQMELQLGSTNKTLQDGTRTWNGSAADALTLLESTPRAGSF